MGDVRQRVVTAAGRVRRSLVRRGADAPGRESRGTGDLTQLRRRVAELELEVQENRRLDRRLEELIDLAADALLPAEPRDAEPTARSGKNSARG